MTVSSSPAILTMGNPRRRIARVPLLFRARDCEDEDGIYALSYGKRVGLVHTRSGATGPATSIDETGRLFRVPADRPRLSWEYTTAGTRVRTLLGEGAGTNLLIRSQEFDTWGDGASCTVTPNAVIAPDGTLTADMLTASATGSFRSRTYIATGDGTKAFSIFMKAGTSPQSSITVYDSFAAVSRHIVRITWTAGIPSLSTAAGSGTLYPVEYWFDSGMWRIPFSSDGIIAANTNTFLVYPHSTGPGTGTVYVWGAQAENASVPSSYIATGASIGSRAADSAHLPTAFVPQALSLYVNSVDRGAGRGISGAIVALSDAAYSDPRLLLGDNGAGNGAVYGQWRAAAVESNSVTPASSFGDRREVHLGLSASGVMTASQSLNGAATVVGTPGSAVALAAGFSAATLRLVGGLAVQSLVLSHGLTLDQCRELSEVT